MPRESGSSGDKSLLVLHLFVRTALFKCEWNRFHMDHSAWEPCAGRIKGDKAYKWEQGLAGYGLDRQSHVTNSPILPGSPLLSQWLAMSVKYYSYVGFYVVRQQQFQKSSFLLEIQILPFNLSVSNNRSLRQRLQYLTASTAPSKMTLCKSETIANSIRTFVLFS